MWAGSIFALETVSQILTLLRALYHRDIIYIEKPEALRSRADLWACGLPRLRGFIQEIQRAFAAHRSSTPSLNIICPLIASGTVVFSIHEVIGYLAPRTLIDCFSIGVTNLTVRARNYFSIQAMGKTKSAGKDAIKAAKPTEVKAISSVKAGAVTKPSQTSKSKSKEMAKQVAVKADKKSKKAKKEPTPVSDSESSDSEELEEGSSASSASSDEDSDAESPKLSKKVNGGTSNGTAEALALMDSDSDSSDSSADSEDEDEDEDEGKSTADILSTAKALKVEASKKSALSDESSEGSSDESDEEDDAVLGGTESNDKLEKEASKEV